MGRLLMKLVLQTQKIFFHFELIREEGELTDVEVEVTIFGAGGNIGWEKGQLPFAGFWLRRR